VLCRCLVDSRQDALSVARGSSSSLVLVEMWRSMREMIPYSVIGVVVIRQFYQEYSICGG
jgi:hypothetical protein